MTNTPNTWNETAVSQPDSICDVIIWSPGDIDMEVGFFDPEKQQWFVKVGHNDWEKMFFAPTHWMQVVAPNGKTF